MPAQCLRRWSNIVQMSCKWFVFAGMYPTFLLISTPKHYATWRYRVPVPRAMSEGLQKIRDTFFYEVDVLCIYHRSVRKSDNYYFIYSHTTPHNIMGLDVPLYSVIHLTPHNIMGCVMYHIIA